MEKSAALSLKAIATARKSEIESLLEAIEGRRGSILTGAIRPSMRKDDPPEEE